MISRFLDYVSNINMRYKINLLLAFSTVFLPAVVLVLANTYGINEVNSLIAGYLAVCLILFLPLSNGLCHIMGLRSIRQLNDQCYKLKTGEYEFDSDLPPEQGEEHDFLRLKRNMHWMGYAIAVREQKLSAALEDLNAAQRQIVESIEYARLIQEAFLPARADLGRIFREHFLIWEQRDKVGGDSYWLKEGDSGVYVAVIDCTGHGIPGAFMTLIVHSLFEKAVEDAPEGDPAQVLERMNGLIKDALGQHSKQSVSDDGMDCALCHLDVKREKLVFAGANNPLLYEKSGRVRTIKGDRCGLGYVRSDRDFRFANHELALEPGMRFYLFTDGLVDQIGGPNRLPFGRSRLAGVLAGSASGSFGSKGEEVVEALRSYQGGEDSRDDRTILGFMI